MANIESSADRSDETGEAPDSALLSRVARERPRHPAAPCPPSALLGVPTPSWLPCGAGGQGRPATFTARLLTTSSLCPSAPASGEDALFPRHDVLCLWRRHISAQREPLAGPLLRWLGDDHHGHRTERDRGPGCVLLPPLSLAPVWVAPQWALTLPL